MSRSSRSVQSLIACLSLAAVAWLGGERPGAAADAAVHQAAFREQVVPLVTRFCVDCHGAEDPEGDLSLAGITPAMETPLQIAVWKQVLDRLDGLQMPPIEAEQPSADERGRAIGWIKSALRARGERFDELKPLASSRGNRVDHDALFSAPDPAHGQAGHAGTAGRVWRVSSRAYTEFFQRIDDEFALDILRHGLIKCPWGLPETWDFSDYSAAHRLTEAELEVHVINGTTFAKALRKRRSLPAVEAAAAAGKGATAEAVTAAVREAFTKLLRREPGPEDALPYEGFLKQGLEAEDPAAAEMFLVSVLSHPEVLYRIERPGAGPAAIQEPRGLARSIALALTDREPDAELVKAADAGKLGTAADVRGQIRRILDDESIAKPRILQFFREYFDYTPADSVFKDPTTTSRQHRIEVWRCGQGFPEAVADTDALVNWAVTADRQVLRTLLTTPKVVVLAAASQGRRDALQRAEAQKKKDAEQAAREGKPFDPQHAKYAVGSVLPGNQWMTFSRQVYGFLSLEEWMGRHGNDMLHGTGVLPATPTGFRLTPEMFDAAAPEPIDAPPGQRMGMLTQPAWLVAQSSNVDNHPIHRGRWIRERLLGGTIPDVPITVNAMLPHEPHHGLRERMRVTRKEYCWNCHRLMDPLGLPFEQYDHYGRFRIAEIVEDAEKTAAARAKNPLSGPTMRAIPFETTGAIEASGDSSIDGPVQDPFELIERLAKSKRVEQVFVRHVFRFFLGRNETLADGPTLQAAHRAYVDSDGSLKALLVSLLSSEPFLCRTGGGVADRKDGQAAVPVAPPAAR